MYGKDYIWNPATCSYKNGKCVGSIIDDSAITCHEIMGRRKTILTKTVPAKNILTKSNSKNFYILLAFLLITIALLIAVSIYCYLILSKTKFIATLRHKQKTFKKIILIM